MGAPAAMLAAVLLLTPITVPAGYPGAVAPATAACPDAEVVFARGRFEPPGIGTVGNAFVSALRSKVNKNVGVYAVKYPADNQIDVGANDMSAHIQSMANSCPNTRLVPGGYSLGAAVTDVVLAVPTQMWGFTNPLPPGSDEHIAAVALFGNGSQWVGPITNFSPAYNDRTIELCHGDDPVCHPADPNTWEANWPQHLAGAYVSSGMVNQAADFVAGKLQ
ncbi:cutinase CUT2 [Mycobacterium tuberculosis]|nr:cutinase CUT2 [Mycobacterium tuberculosis]